MPFSDVYKDEGAAGSFIGEDEWDEIIKSQTALRVVSVSFSPAGQYGPKYHLNVDLDGEVRTKSFGVGKEFKDGNPSSRDSMLEALGEYLKRDDADPVWLRPEMVKQFCKLVDVSDEFASTA